MNMCPTNKCKSAPESCLKGQVFFILTNCANLETLKNRILLLGGKVEEFLSKDVTTLLVEDNQLVGLELLPPELSVKPAYNTVNGTIVATFPYPGSLSNIPSTSRGYNFIAANTSSKYSPYRVICYARQFGIQVLGIAQFLTWTEPQIKVIRQKQPRKTPENVSNLSGYFIKFESVNKHYRPCYKMFNSDPDRLVPLKNASVLIKPETCDVILNKPVHSKHLQYNHMDTTARLTHQAKAANLPAKVNDKKPQNNRLRPKEDNNYCECCKTHFSDFKQHIKSSKHQNFVSNEKNYESVHSIMKMLPTPQEFIENLQKPSLNSESALPNGDTSLCMSVTNIVETDYSVPLNLQVKQENVSGSVMPINMHVNKNVSKHNLQIPKEEEMPLPLDLHIKKDGIKTEIKQEATLIADFVQVGLYKKEQVVALLPKIEGNNVLGSTKVEEKQPLEVQEGVQCDEINGDSFDRTNTAALAQLCLKNFDSYWLDSLPCEVDDMVFDDIFDFDDGKPKIGNEGFEPFVDEIANSEIAQTPGLVSGISTSNLKTQYTENTSILLNTSIDVKDFIKTEPPDFESTTPPCKLGKENEVSVLPENISAPFTESLLEDKKPIFSIASFCSDKVGIEVTPSCSNTIPSKNLEPLFSSESSDDENGNVLISNALHFITNSDNEIKVDKGSSDENSLHEKFEKKLSPKEENIKSEFKEVHINDEHSVVINVSDSCKAKVQSVNQNESPLIHPVHEVNLPAKNLQESNILSNVPANNAKVNAQNNEDCSRESNFVTDHLKNQNEISLENIANRNIKSLINIKNGYDISAGNPSKLVSSSVTHADTQPCISNLSIKNTSETLPYSLKSDLPDHKEGTLDKPKEWDYTCNKIYKKYQVPLNRTLDNSKVVKEIVTNKINELEAPVINQNKPEKVIVIKSSIEKYPNPKKNISMRETMTSQSKSDTSSVSKNEIPEKNQAVTPVKNVHLKVDTQSVHIKNETNVRQNVTTTNFILQNTIPSVRNISQTSHEPYLSIKNILAEDTRVLSKNKNISEAEHCDADVRDLSTKSVPYENRAYSLISSNKILNSHEKIPPKYEQVQIDKPELYTSITVSSNPNHYNRISKVSKIDVTNFKNINVLGEVSAGKKNSDFDLCLKSSKVNSTSGKPVSSETRVSTMRHGVDSILSREVRVHKYLNENFDINVNQNALSTTILPVNPLSLANKANQDHHEGVALFTSLPFQEGKFPIVQRCNSEANVTTSSLNTSVTSYNLLKSSTYAVSSHNKNFLSKNHDTQRNPVIKSHPNSLHITSTAVKPVNPICFEIAEEFDFQKEQFSSVKFCPAQKSNENTFNSSNNLVFQVDRDNSQNQTSLISTAASVKNSDLKKVEEMSLKGQFNTKSKIILNNINQSVMSEYQISHKNSLNQVPYNVANRKSLQPQETFSYEEKCSHEGMLHSSSSNASHSMLKKVSYESSQSQSFIEDMSVTDGHGQPDKIVTKRERHNSSVGINLNANHVSNASSNQLSYDNIPSRAPHGVAYLKKRQTLNVMSHKKRKFLISQTNTSSRTDISVSNVSSYQDSASCKKLYFKKEVSQKVTNENTELINYPTSNTTHAAATPASCEKKVNQTNYEYFVPFKRKRAHKKEKKVHKKLKHNPVLVKKCSLKEPSSSVKEQLHKISSNPSQYSCRTAKYKVSIYIYMIFYVFIMILFVTK